MVEEERDLAVKTAVELTADLDEANQLLETANKAIVKFKTMAAKMSEDKIRAYKKFSNKIWNASRFVLENISDEIVSDLPENISLNDLTPFNLNETHLKHLAHLRSELEDIQSDMTNYRYYLAGDKLYHYFWHTFADVIIEEAKKEIEDGGKKSESAQKMLYIILVTSLKAMHPFIPFVTEEIWQALPKKGSELLMVSDWAI
jgi:valyl-tRNA synthetase